MRAQQRGGRVFENRFTISAPESRCAVTATNFSDGFMLHFEHELFGFNTDRADGLDGGKYRRIDSDLGYPRWTNNLAPREQIAIQLEDLPGRSL
ncbi:hypothetical protein PQR57_45170 [Paraburkholderia dipogonis]|uniref:Uncharacterized protein n=1 Tax=Paraburkholderia dipogonis TaxID=1211383 RepID=A0ABW9B8T1_9BURK